LLDGVLTEFGGFSAAVDEYDAIKMSNAGEGLSVMRGSEKIVVERRPDLVSADTIFFNLGNLRTQHYQFRFLPGNFYNEPVQGYLVDTYLNQWMPVSLMDSTVIDFMVTADPASYRQDRFMLVFRLPVAEPAIAINKGIHIAPNPVTGRIINLYFSEMEAGRYMVRLTNPAGQVVFATAIEHAGGTKRISLNNAGTIPAGMYLLGIVLPAGNRFTETILIN
jgi:hypothetical protein